MEYALQDSHLRIIREHYPGLAQGQVTLLAGGNDHFVLVVKQEMVFRFSRQPGEVKQGVLNFVKHFSHISPVPVPIAQMHFDEPSGTWYEVSPFIPGVSFYPEVAESFTHAELMRVAQQMGQFLGVMHSFPLEQARNIGVDEMDPSTFWQYMHEDAYPGYERVLFSHISKRAQDWIRELFAEYISAIRATPFITKVTHSDMWVFHIIVDPHRRVLSGVIDFATRIADPANDFKAFEHYGSDFVKEVYDNYCLPTDDGFEMRRLFYTGHDMVFMLARSVEEGSPKEAKLAEERLMKYIDAHPHPLAR